jgi:phosphate transport system permease protein
MSEGFARDTALVGQATDRFHRVLDGTIALTIVSFLLGLLALTAVLPLDASGPALRATLVDLLLVVAGAVGLVGVLSLFGVVSITADRVRGIGLGLVVSTTGLAILAAALPVTLATLFGLVLVVVAAVVLAAGVASRIGLVHTDAASTPGLGAGAAFGVVGLLLGAALGGTVLGGGSLAYYGSGLVGGLLLFGVTVLPREDVGSAVPVAVLVGTLGLVVASGTIAPGWSWSPGADIDGSVTGGIAIPLFVLLGSVVSSWGAAKARAGYGARGRQYGAFLVVYLNAMVMVAIMLSIVSFVASKGLTYALHGVEIGALTALVFLLPAVAIAADVAREPAGSTRWHTGARQLVRVAPLAVVGAFLTTLVLVGIRGRPVSIPFTYTVLQNREQVVLETAATVVAEPRVGALVVGLVGLFLTWYVLRRYGSIRNVGDHHARMALVERAVGVSLGLIGVLGLLAVLPLPGPLAVVGTLAAVVSLPLVVLGAVGGGGLVVAPAIALAVGEGRLGDRGISQAQVVRVGLFGALGLVLGAVVLQAVAGVNPAIGPVDLVPAVAGVGMLAALTVAVLATLGSRSVPAEQRRVLGQEAALGLGTAAGFLVLLAGHVALTGVSFSVGPVTVATTGTLSWPMTMSPYLPLSSDPGGIMPAVVGTMWLVVGAATFAVPLGVGAAVFLTEYAEQGRITATVEVATNALWSTPSIVFGLFGAAFLIPRIGGDESLLSGMLVLGFMLLPLVLITSREAIKSVPDEYRDASAALGVDKWRTIRSVVLPAAIPGVITGGILGIGRIAGETAPLILVLGSTLNSTESIDVFGSFRFVAEPPFVENPALLEASAALPTQVWAVIAAGVSGSQSMGWASALVLLLVVLTFYAVGITARTYFRRKLDHE